MVTDSKLTEAHRRCLEPDGRNKNTVRARRIRKRKFSELIGCGHLTAGSNQNGRPLNGDIAGSTQHGPVFPSEYFLLANQKPRRKQTTEQIYFLQPVHAHKFSRAVLT